MTLQYRDGETPPIAAKETKVIENRHRGYSAIFLASLTIVIGCGAITSNTINASRPYSPTAEQRNDHELLSRGRPAGRTASADVDRGAPTAQPSAACSEAAHDGPVRKGVCNRTIVCRLAAGRA